MQCTDCHSTSVEKTNFKNPGKLKKLSNLSSSTPYARNPHLFWKNYPTFEVICLGTWQVSPPFLHVVEDLTTLNTNTVCLSNLSSQRKNAILQDVSKIPKIPDLDSAILRARVHPFSITLKTHSSDIVGVCIVTNDLLNQIKWKLTSYGLVVQPINLLKSSICKPTCWLLSVLTS